MAKRNLGDEYINHFNGVRIRVEGFGNLDLSFNTLSQIKTETLTPIIMLSSTDRQEHRLADLRTEKVQFTFSVDEIDEYFEIGRIMIFYKPIATSYPQR